MATQQNDIKRILAYSTLSQLGYMVMAVGVLADKAAMFHLFTHAFFKALLFLGAGSVIVGLHHEQDIWKMGGIAKKMPVTFLTFAIATLALTGCPGLSGFFSKDMILLAAHEKSSPIFWLALGTAFLTAFYMVRLVVVAFLSLPKDDAARHAHESPAVMTLPLLLLAGASVVAGYGFITKFFFSFHEEAHHESMVPALAVGAFVVGSLAAFALYRGKTKDPIYIPMFANKFYFDEIYALIIRFTQDLLARVSDFFDRWVLDGAAVKGASYGAYGLGFLLRCLQIGNLQAYTFFFGLGVVGLLFYVILK
jgi:NADH-quinone oxidoreductase subunit L